MKFIEICNGSMLYEYNNGTAVAIGCIDGSVEFFSCYDYAYAWALPF